MYLKEGYMYSDVKRWMRMSLVICILLFNLKSKSQSFNWNWAKSPTSLFSNSATDILTDELGNIFLTGIFTNTIDFDTITLTGNGANDIFIAKIDAFGNAIWAKSFGGSEDDYSVAIDIDYEGNLVIAFEISSPSISFDSLTLFNSNPAWDEKLILAKIDSDGEIIWIKYEELFSGFINDLTTDNLGNIYLTGWFGNEQFIVNTDTLHAEQNLDVFIIKYDINGNGLWAKGIGSDGFDEGFGIKVDNSNNVIATGRFGRTICFDSIPLVNPSLDYSTDIFLVKYNPNGEVIWAKAFSGSSTDIGINVETDQYNNIYCTGNFSSTFLTVDSIIVDNISASSNDFYIAKLDSTGQVLWINAEGGSSTDNVQSLSVDQNGNSVITGLFASETITFLNTTLTKSEDVTFDLFVTAYDSDGQVTGALSAGGTGYERSKSITMDDLGNIYVTGHFNSPNIQFGDDVLLNLDSNQISTFLARIGNKNVSLYNPPFELHKPYPNPFTSSIYLKTDNSFIEKKFYISDILGNELMSGKIESSTSEFNLIDLKRGIYFLTIIDNLPKSYRILKR